MKKHLERNCAAVTRRDFIKAATVVGGVVMAGRPGAGAHLRHLEASSVPGKADVHFAKDISAKTLVDIYFYEGGDCGHGRSWPPGRQAGRRPRRRPDDIHHLA